MSFLDAAISAKWMETLDWRFKIDHKGTTPFRGLGNLTLKKSHHDHFIKNLWLCNVLECNYIDISVCSVNSAPPTVKNTTRLLWLQAKSITKIWNAIHHWAFILFSKWRKCLSPAFIPEWLERWRNLGEVFQSNTVHIMLECLFFYCIWMCVWYRLKGWGMLRKCKGTFPQARS